MNTAFCPARTSRTSRLAALAAALLLALPLAACGFGETPQREETPPGPVENFMIISTPGNGLPAERIRSFPSTEWSSGGSTQIVPVVSVMP